MSKLHLQIEEMRIRLTENAHNEQALLKALGEALVHVDQKLLSEVRSLTAEHEARRGAILGELQMLASRLCAFPLPREPHPPAIDNALPESPTAVGANGYPHAPGDWRMAAGNIEDDLDIYWRSRDPRH